MSHCYILSLPGLTLIGVGFVQGGSALILVWLGCDFLAVGIAHARRAHRLFGKRADGSLPLWSWLLFFPLLTLSIVVWFALRLLIREPAHNAVTKDLVIGRRLVPREVDSEFANYIDLTAEFSEPTIIRRSAGYQCFPLLDGSAPKVEALREALKSLRPGRTYIHCAQGHGRTALFALALMLESGQVKSVSEGLEKLKAVRPRVGLSAVQRKCIEEFATALPRR